MKHTAPLASLLVATVAACGGGAARSTVSNQQGPTGHRCPAADRVLIASFSAGTAGETWPDEGTPRWRVPLVVGALDYGAATSERSPAAPITADALRAAGAPTLPAQVWMFRETGEPCAATVGTAYRAQGGSGVPFEELGVELTGCAAPVAGRDQMLAWVSLDEAPGCTLVPTADDNMRSWSEERWDGVPRGSGSVPAELAGFVPPTPSGATPASLLWETRVSRAGNRALAWEMSTAQVTSPLGTEACMLEEQEVLQHFAVVGGRVVPLAATEGDRVWARMAGVLATDGTPRVVLLSGIGIYATIGVGADGTVAAPRTVEYYIPHDEDNLTMDLVPYCGP